MKNKLPSNVVTNKVHISQVKAGDTIVHEGVLSTVSRSNIRESDGFMGITIFGDSYNNGNKEVIVAHFISKK